jgi:cellulose synthase/poly-beta-1,6-N-acetylglucosamine synthase-like glycosyltransferase
MSLPNIYILFDYIYCVYVSYILVCVYIYIYIQCIYLLTYNTDQSPGKPIGFQLVKKLPTFYRARSFITAFTCGHHLSLS